MFLRHNDKPIICFHYDCSFYISFLQSTRSEREPAPMHTVSPALSTRVPHAPATTPATHQTPTGTFTRDNTMKSQGQMQDIQEQKGREGVSSPTQNIRAPTNSPRLSPEPTGEYSSQNDFPSAVIVTFLTANLSVSFLDIGTKTI